MRDEVEEARLRAEVKALQAEVKALQAEVKRLEDRVQVDPGGSDRIDELEEHVMYLRHDVQTLQGALEEMVSACRFNCNGETYCGVCSIALKVLPRDRVHD